MRRENKLSPFNQIYNHSSVICIQSLAITIKMSTKIVKSKENISKSLFGTNSKSMLYETKYQITHLQAELQTNLISFNTRLKDYRNEGLINNLQNSLK